MQKVWKQFKWSILTAILPFSLMSGLISGCGGGGGGSTPPPSAGAFAGNYKGLAYYTSGSLNGQVRGFDVTVAPNGALSSPTGSFNTARGSVDVSGTISFNRREGDRTLTVGSGQLTPDGTGFLTVSNTGGTAAITAVARLTGITNSFAGNYVGTARVTTGTGIGTVRLITASVQPDGTSIVNITGTDNVIFRATGTADLTTGTLTVTGTTNGSSFTVTIQLVRTGRAKGVFETSNSRSDVDFIYKV